MFSGVFVCPQEVCLQRILWDTPDADPSPDVEPAKQTPLDATPRPPPGRPH